MRFRTRLLITLVIAGGVAAGAWCYLARERLAQRWAARSVAAADTVEQAASAIVVIEEASDREARIRELTSHWGTGDPQFDLYLAWYVGTPKSSEFLRETFSLEFAWREQQLPRWAHYWSWRVSQEPDREIASAAAYFDLLAADAAPRSITWREVLDLQAIFALTDQPRLAFRLSPENWRDRYRRWREAVPGEVPHVDRPESPLPDWQGPAPDRKRLAGQ